MADGLVVTGTTGIDIDNSVVGSSAYRQRVVIGSDVSSGALANPSSVWPTSAAFGLPVRIIGSSGIVLGSVAQSSNWNISTGAIVNLSSALSNYVTNSTTVPVYLGASTSNIVGIVGLSSAVVLSSGVLTLGTLTTGTVVGLTTTSVVGMTTTSIVSLSSAVSNYVTNSTTVPVYISTGSFVSLSSALTNYVTNSTTVPVYLGGGSTAAIVGIVGLSSAVTLSSGTLTIGTLTTGTIVGLTTTALVGLSSAANMVTSQTTAGAAGSSVLYVGAGIVASTANTATMISSGLAQQFQVDRAGAQTVNLEGPRQFIKTANLVTVANTCFQQLIPAPGASLVNDIVTIEAFTTTLGSTTIVSGVITVLSSCGQAVPGIWNFKWFYWNQYSTQGDPSMFRTFPIPLTQLTANNAWGILSTGAAMNITVQYVVGTS